MGKLSVFVP